MNIRKIIPFTVAGLVFAPLPALALNYHELEVYPYRTAQKGELELEYGGVYTDRGTRDADSSDNNQNRLRNSLELTYGLTDKTEITAYADYDRVPGGGGGFEGNRFHVRTRFFEKGELPVDLGAYVELELPKHDEDIQEMEFRGIVEKDIGKWTFDFNPILEKVIRGESVDEGWEFKYASLSGILWVGHIMRGKTHGYADEEETNDCRTGGVPRAVAGIAAGADRRAGQRADDAWRSSGSDAGV